MARRIKETEEAYEKFNNPDYKLIGGKKELPGEKKKIERGSSLAFVKGARTKTGTYDEGDIAAEKGKKTTYDIDVQYSPSNISDRTYTKAVYKKKKGAKSGEDTWEFKRSKDISQEKYERQTTRKKKRYKKDQFKLRPGDKDKYEIPKTISEKKGL